MGDSIKVILGEYPYKFVEMVFTKEFEKTFKFGFIDFVVVCGTDGKKVVRVIFNPL